MSFFVFTEQIANVAVKYITDSRYPFKAYTVTKNPRFPSIREAAKLGPLSEYCLRLMLKDGKLPGTYSGRKFLVNYERLLEQLSGEAVNAQ